jgi:DNA-binding LacI/PurR family transcriptional regulator
LETVQAHNAIAIVFETSRLRLLHEGPDGREVLGSSWVDGWLAINEFADAPLTAELRARGQPLIHVHAKPESPTGCAVLPDNLGGMRAVTEHLIQHGHRRIAFAGNLNHVDVGERFDGYCAALQANGIALDTALVFDTLHHKEADGRKVAEQLLERRAANPNAQLPVSALVAATDRLALGAIAGFTQAGLSLPQDLAIVGFDDTGAAQLAEPALTTVKQSFTEVAARAVVELLKALRRACADPTHHSPFLWLRYFA